LDQTIVILFFILFFFWIFEKYISNAWIKIYYRFGIPIACRKDFKVNEQIILKKDSDFEFHSEGENIIYFRYGKFKQIGGPQFFDFSAFRGYIENSVDQKERKLYCFVNWYIFFLILLLLNGIFSAKESSSKLLILGVLLIISWALLEKFKKFKKAM